MYCCDIPWPSIAHHILHMLGHSFQFKNLLLFCFCIQLTFNNWIQKDNTSYGQPYDFADVGARTIIGMSYTFWNYQNQEKK